MSLKKYSRIKKIFENLSTVRTPRHRLATFGVSTISYSLVTNVPGYPDRAKLRTGAVTAERPQIITLQDLEKKFSGFGEEMERYSDMLAQHFGAGVKGLQYQFRNEPLTSRVELTTPERLTAELAKDFDKASDFRTALLQSTDQYWELCLMKFIVEETMASFNSNVRELEDRGFFEGPDRDANRHHREIRALLTKARMDKSFVSVLGQKLKEYGLFNDYQDAFFQLLHS